MWVLPRFYVGSAWFCWVMPWFCLDFAWVLLSAARFRSGFYIVSVWFLSALPWFLLLLLLLWWCADVQPRTPLHVKKIVNNILQRFLYLNEIFYTPWFLLGSNWFLFKHGLPSTPISALSVSDFVLGFRWFCLVSVLVLPGICPWSAWVFAWYLSG